MLHFRPNELDISIWYWILPHNYLDMIIKLKEGKEGENKINPVTARRDSGSKFFICCKTEYVLSGTYQRGPSQRAMSPDCSWHPLLQGYVVVNSGLKKGSMCELRCYEGVLKKPRLFHTKHEGERLSIYHKHVSHFLSPKPQMKQHSSRAVAEKVPACGKMF